jgi:hypothetical protein
MVVLAASVISKSGKGTCCKHHLVALFISSGSELLGYGIDENTIAQCDVGILLVSQELSPHQSKFSSISPIQNCLPHILGFLLTLMRLEHFQFLKKDEMQIWIVDLV